MAQKLSAQLSADRKIMLGVQLYDLISQAGLKQEQVVAFYSFMSQLGMAAQAIDIVYQLNASEDADAAIYQRGASPLESLSFGTNGAADVTLKSLTGNDRLLAFRYHDLILLKNYTGQTISVRGRPLLRGGFCRIYPGQRILVGDQFLTYQELAAYFNAKKNVSLPQIFVRVHKDADEVQLERSRTRESALEVTFGLKVRVKALRDVDAVLNDVKLKSGTTVEATLEDRIVFHNDSEMDLLDLRRRARAMGGRFQLKASKSEYLVSNNPSMLEEDDILLSPGHERRRAPQNPVRLRQARRHPGSDRRRPAHHGGRDAGSRHRAASGWRHHPHRCRPISALQFFRADHRRGAEHHSLARSGGRHPSLREQRGRPGRRLVFDQSRRAGLRDGRERLGQEHAHEGARRPAPADPGRNPPERSPALSKPRFAQGLHQLHPAGGRVRRAPHDRRKPPVRRRHPRPASFRTRPHPPPRGQAHRARA